MLSLLFALSLAFVLPVAAHGAAAKESQAYQWRLTEMNPSILEVDLLPGVTTCGQEQCTFGLYYFLGEGYGPGRKTILLIPGGPGQIIDPQKRPLAALEKYYNVVYFHVRGTGTSAIPSANKYDNFLRAKYVVEDLERIRERLKIKAWDAIYAHSWGTIVAQLYAEKSEINTWSRPRDEGEAPTGTLVKKLVLSAPVARAHQGTEQARREMILSNLRDIYLNYSSSDSPSKCKATLQNRAVSLKKTAPGSQPKSATAVALSAPEGTDDFCFLISDRDLPKIIDVELSRVLERLDEKYGSIGFVVNSYEELAKTQSFSDLFRQPSDFFEALKTLQLLGGREQPPFSVDNEQRQKKINAALLLGYYSSLPEEFWDKNHPSNPHRKPCDPSAPLFLPLPNDDWRMKFCRRLNGAKIAFHQSNELESVRGFTVFGVYDGLSRWVVEKLKQYKSRDASDCFTGNDIREVSDGLIEIDESVKTQAKKLGTDPSEEICPWDPGKHPHSVPTLILKGGADPIIAGQQAEMVFESLTGKRVLVEFPGVGHAMEMPDIKIAGKVMDGATAVAKVVMEFVSAPDEEVPSDPDTRKERAKLQREVDRILGQLKAKVQPPRSR
jgi:pimeloyl-ACP methyl ester carboxylesterase